MDPASALKVGCEAVSLVSALAELVKRNDAPNASGRETTLREVLVRLQVEAVSLSRMLEGRLRHLVEHYEVYGLNPAKSLDENLTDLSWYDFRKRSRIKSFRDECLAIYQQLGSFIDDATSVLICEQRIELASDAFKASLETKRQLDQLFLKRNAPVREILEGLLATASRVSSELSLA